VFGLGSVVKKRVPTVGRVKVSSCVPYPVRSHVVRLSFISWLYCRRWYSFVEDALMGSLVVIGFIEKEECSTEVCLSWIGNCSYCGW